VVSLSNHERLNIQAVKIFRSPFDRLRANGKIVKLMALKPERGNDQLRVLKKPAASRPAFLIVPTFRVGTIKELG